MKKETIVAIAAAFAGFCACAAPAERELRILSYNIYHCEGADKTIDISRTAAAIKRTAPDFAGLQEVDRATSRSKRLDQAAELARQLGMHATFAKAIPNRGGEYGVALLSKEKPLSVERIPLPGKNEKRVLLLCEFPDYWVCTTHLALQEENRLKAVAIIREAVEKRAASKPVFLTGDWNAKPDSKPLAAMSEFMTILSPQKCRTLHVFKKHPPDSEFCIDYIAVDTAHAAAFAVKEAFVVPDATTSDHFPVAVALKVE